MRMEGNISKANPWKISRKLTKLLQRKWISFLLGELFRTFIKFPTYEVDTINPFKKDDSPIASKPTTSKSIFWPPGPTADPGGPLCNMCCSESVPKPKKKSPVMSTPRPKYDLT